MFVKWIALPQKKKEKKKKKKKHDLSSKGFLAVEYMGKREQLPVNTKGSQVSPRLAEVVVKQLDPRWARQGATAALLKAAGYSTDVAVKTEYAGDLPAHLSCWSSHIGRSDVAVAKVAAPASDPSLRKLPRSIQFQGLKISISVSRSLQNKHEQRHARAVDTSGKQKAKKQKRQANRQQAKQKQRHTPAQVPFSGPAASEAGVGLPRAMPDEEPLLEAFFDGRGGLPVLSGPPAALARLRPDAALASDAENSGVTLAVASSSHVDVLGAAAPLTGKRRDPESGSESSGLVEAPSADALAMVPVTPGDGQAQGLRRSLREHKKPRPYYAGAEPQPPDKQPAGKGLQRGFFN